MSNDCGPWINGVDHLIFVLQEGMRYIESMTNRQWTWPQALWRVTFLRHLSYWMAAFALYFCIIRLFESTRLALTVATVLTVPGPFPVYMHFWALRRFFEKRRYRLYIVTTLLIIAASEPITQAVHHLVDRNPDSHTSGMGMAVLYILITAGFYYFNKGLRQQYRMQEAEHKQTITELALLKSQINPHFFFNTLNSLYALSLDQSDRVPEVILKLSDLMRYVLDGSQKESVSLDEEVRFLENYIELERLRLNPGTRLDIRLEARDRGLQIVPLILVPFVENGFKHGLHATTASGFMTVNLAMEDDWLRLAVENSKPDAATLTTGGSPGLGLANVQRRLALLYPHRHNLSIEDGDQTYRVALGIRL